MNHPRSDTPDQSLREALRKALNKGGFPFQYSVLAKVAERGEGGPLWTRWAAEFPVPSRPKGGKLDFVLRAGNTWVIAECKRVNPRLGNWAFAQAPFVRRGAEINEILVETVRHLPNQPAPTATWTEISRRQGIVEVYHVAVEVEANTKGDECGKPRGEIEEAVGQVIAGQSGLLTAIQEHPHLLETGQIVTLLPVVFTTARLFTSDVKLDQADLTSGTIDKLLNSREVQFVAYHYGASPSILHEVPHRRPRHLDEVPVRNLRTVFVVSASGIWAFLDWAGAHFGVRVSTPS